VEEEMNELIGKPLRYLIGTSFPGSGHQDEITEVAYDVLAPVQLGLSVAYCNFFDEENSGKYGPYLHNSDTAEEYGEGQIDPNGAGFIANLADQFERRQRQGFRYVELDNPDAYKMKDIMRGVQLAATYGLAVVAKNPLLIEGDPLPYVASCCGAIVEKDAGEPGEMDDLRRKAGKPDLPVWFVAFGKGLRWIKSISNEAHNLGMFCTYSTLGEYKNAHNVNGDVHG